MLDDMFDLTYTQGRRQCRPAQPEAMLLTLQIFTIPPEPGASPAERVSAPRPASEANAA